MNLSDVREAVKVANKTGARLAAKEVLQQRNGGNIVVYGIDAENRTVKMQGTIEDMLDGITQLIGTRKRPIIFIQLELPF